MITAVHDEDIPTPQFVTYGPRVPPPRFKLLREWVALGRLSMPSELFANDPEKEQRIMDAVYVDEVWVERLTNIRKPAEIPAEHQRDPEDLKRLLKGMEGRFTDCIQTMEGGQYWYGHRTEWDGYEYTSVHVKGNTLLEKVRKIVGIRAFPLLEDGIPWMKQPACWSEDVEMEPPALCSPFRPHAVDMEAEKADIDRLRFASAKYKYNPIPRETWHRELRIVLEPDWEHFWWISKSCEALAFRRPIETRLAPIFVHPAAGGQIPVPPSLPAVVPAEAPVEEQSVVSCKKVPLPDSVAADAENGGNPAPAAASTQHRPTVLVLPEEPAGQPTDQRHPMAMQTEEEEPRTPSPQPVQQTTGVSAPRPKKSSAPQNPTSLNDLRRQREELSALERQYARVLAGVQHQSQMLQVRIAEAKAQGTSDDVIGDQNASSNLPTGPQQQASSLLRKNATLNNRQAAGDVQGSHVRNENLATPPSASGTSHHNNSNSNNNNPYPSSTGVAEASTGTASPLPQHDPLSPPQRPSRALYQSTPTTSAGAAATRPAAPRSAAPPSLPAQSSFRPLSVRSERNLGNYQQQSGNLGAAMKTASRLRVTGGVVASSASKTALRLQRPDASTVHPGVTQSSTGMVHKHIPTTHQQQRPDGKYQYSSGPYNNSANSHKSSANNGSSQPRALPTAEHPIGAAHNTPVLHLTEREKRLERMFKGIPGSIVDTTFPAAFFRQRSADRRLNVCGRVPDQSVHPSGGAAAAAAVAAPSASLRRKALVTSTTRAPDRGHLAAGVAARPVRQYSQQKPGIMAVTTSSSRLVTELLHPSDTNASGSAVDDGYEEMEQRRPFAKRRVEKQGRAVAVAKKT